jgi:polyisoprenoid-binding protein YceI
MTDTRNATELTTWIIDPKHTLVEFAARYMTLTTVKGRFSSVSGTIRAPDIDADLGGSSVEVEIDSASLDSREAQRDAHLRSADFLDVERYPSITFTSTRLERIDGDRFRVHGALTIRDVTREVALEVTRQGQARTPTGLEVAGFTAETQIDRNDFGLKWNVALEAGGWLVADRVKILIELQAIRQD